MSTYDYYWKALVNPAALHHRDFAITTTPEPGYYRTRRMNEPVAIWEDHGSIVMLVNDREVVESDHENVWLNCAKYPVSEDAYYKAIETGRWDDLDEVVADTRGDRRNDPEGMIDELVEQAKLYRDISDDDTAKRAISLRNAILEQHKRADGLREEAKKPHLKAAREVDEIWMPVVKKAKSAADVLRALVEGWETFKRKKARQEEEARRAAEDLNLAQPPMVFQTTPEPVDQIRSGYGKAVSVRTKLVATGISDHNALFVHLINSGSDISRVMLELAQKDIDAGMTVPGVSVEERAVVR